MSFKEPLNPLHDEILLNIDKKYIDFKKDKSKLKTLVALLRKTQKIGKNEYREMFQIK